jgi:hypothetical protein
MPYVSLAAGGIFVLCASVYMVRERLPEAQQVGAHAHEARSACRPGAPLGIGSGVAVGRSERGLPLIPPGWVIRWVPDGSLSREDLSADPLPS